MDLSQSSGAAPRAGRLGQRASNAFYYAAGLVFLGLSAVKNNFFGYATPTPFSNSDTERSLRQALDIFEGWKSSIASAGLDFTKVVRDADVLELGPGAHLGTGALLLAAGARSYCALDAFPLAAAVPVDFYRSLLQRAGAGADAARILHAIEQKDARVIDYVVDPDFDPRRSLAGRSFDLMLSCAAFEHFDDVGDTIAALSELARPHAVCAHAVDFQTHARWIRDKDPNNIYRYSDAVWGSVEYPGKPNRVRPDDYVRLLASNGWQVAGFVGIDAADESYLAASTPALTRQFRRPGARVEILSGTVVASRPTGQ